MVTMKIMLKHRSVFLFFGVFLIAIAGLAAPSFVGAVQFSADVTIVTYGKAAKGKVYVRGETYRMELVKGDKSVVVLVDDKAGLTRVLVHSKKIYLEMKNDDLGSAMNNPFVSYQISQSQYGSADVGQEIVNGYQCTKKLTKTYGKDFLTAWISDKLGFPIKIVNHLRKGDFTELTNIQEGLQKESLFLPPAGYVKMDRMPIEPPSWAGDVPKAPIRKVPFEEALSKGSVIRAPLIKGFKITVRGENLLEGKTAVTAVAFKDGNPVSKPSLNTFNVSRKGQKLAFVPQETIGQADEIVIRVGEGKALIRTELVGPEAASPVAANSGPARMVLVLDGSGSMWGQIDGQAKIVIAKAVMADLIDQIPADFQTGLIVYGHRRKGDCQDIEMLIPVGPHNPAAMKAKVQAISPKGKTPLSEAVRQAAQALRYTEERATVVLVSDGLETCDIDPCELAAELAMSGVDFTVHVIGFDISKEDQLRLRCLADKTGGLFLAAGSAGALRDALFATVEKVKEPPPLVVEDPGTASLSAPPSVPAGSDFKVQWQGPDSRNDYIALYRKTKHDPQRVDYTYTKKGNPAPFVAPGKVGDYELGYVHAHTQKVIGRTDIEVTPVQAQVTAPASVDVAVDFEVQWKGPDYKSDYIAIARPDQRPGSQLFYTYTRRGNPLKLQAPSDPGTYEIRYMLARDRQVLAKTSIEITGVGASLDAPPVADVATDFEVGWQGPNAESDYICISHPGKSPGSRIHYTYTNRGNPVKLQAPSDPGTYEIRYMLGRGAKLLARTTIKIKPMTAQVQAPASADMATDFEVSWKGPDSKSDYIAIARPDQGPGSRVHYTYTNRGNPVKLQAPSDPGTYEIRYILGRGNKLLARTTIEIKAVSAKVNAPTYAKASDTFEVDWQGPNGKSDFISIALPDQRPGSRKGYTYTSRGNPVRLKAPKEPGTYEVRYILGRGNRLLDKTTIEIIP